ncbi:HAD family hydrolase [uncultured Desulfuromusa sp.]|uniref:HAD family hydrolase n=1 Tax=uncultured Desulfuromusa sp. TaxID=219183 RepID=UPI002AA83C27|nr:HAD family hydrolase [uncultured Desulfuromusa sp.]
MSNLRPENRIKAVLFDLDGTLLRAQMREFIPRYLRALSAYCTDIVAPEKFEKTLLEIIRDLIHTEGDGLRTNEERVYSKMQRDLAIPESRMRESLALFEQNDLNGLQHFIHPIPLAKQIVRNCHEAGVPLVLATNPVFPMFMIRARVQWAELEEDSFAFMTSYENSYYCKPQSGYFEGIAAQLNVAPENCLMVGNDINHDLAAVATGMKTYLVDTWLIDRDGPEWPCANRGDHSSLQKFLRAELNC